MNFDEMNQAVEDAARTLRMADSMTEKMVKMVVGRLRKVEGYSGRRALVSLKRELQDFNATTKTWREER